MGRGVLSSITSGGGMVGVGARDPSGVEREAQAVISQTPTHSVRSVHRPISAHSPDQDPAESIAQSCSQEGRRSHAFLIGLRFNLSLVQGTGSIGEVG
ncbi:MAG: hypothetical protein QXS54_08960 [Candidatus Methanomethylicaceae archaeon]